jgi:phospholipid/cholesterol/gamma-HCH transport system substrate-binding protein
MDERQLRFRVGVVVVAAALITIILITLLGAWPSPFEPRYTVFVAFPKAPGVTIDTPVRKSGIQIGRVSDLELLEDGQVELTLKMDARYRLARNQVCRISTGSLVTGDAILEWVEADEDTGRKTEFIEDGDYSKSDLVPTDPIRMISEFEDQIGSVLVSIEGAGQSIDGAGQEVEVVAQRLNQILGRKETVDAGETELESLVDELLLATRNFNSVMADIKQLTGDENLKTQVRDAVQRLPRLFQNAEQVLLDAQDTLKEIKSVALRADKNLAYIEDVTRPLGEKGEAISQNISESIKSVNILLDNLAQLSEALNNEKGTIPQLINDPELYNRALEVLREIDDRVKELEPILNDVRILTYKLGTDPGQIGVKGIFDKRPVNTGVRNPPSARWREQEHRQHHELR